MTKIYQNGVKILDNHSNKDYVNTRIEKNNL